MVSIVNAKSRNQMEIAMYLLRTKHKEEVTVQIEIVVLKTVCMSWITLKYTRKVKGVTRLN